MVRWWRRLFTVGVLVAGLGVVPAKVAEGAIVGSGESLPDSYVVSLRDTPVLRADGVPAVSAGLAHRHGGKVGRIFRHAMQGFTASMSEADARRLAADPAVESVQRNQIHSIFDTQVDPPWGLDRIDQRWQPLNDKYTYPNTASTVHAYIVDTGIRFTHTTFGGRATSGVDTIDNDDDASDCKGHGTGVASVVGGADYGVAKGVWLVSVRVMNCAGKGTSDQVLAGVDWVTEHAIKPAVVNMSLGGDLDPALDKGISRSIASGLTYVAAAGNGDANQVAQDACTLSPARVPEAITVSATDSNDRRPGWANYGTCVDIFAPGFMIPSAYIRSDTDSFPWSGTSMAAPHVAGAAALVLAAHPGWSPKRVADYLAEEATKNVVVDPGTGSPNLMLWVTNPTIPDFLLWMSPVSASVPAGDATVATAATFVSAAPTQPVLVGLVGLPPDTTVTSNAITIDAGESVALRFQTSTTTPPGSYLITVEGTGSTTIRRTEFTLVVLPPPAPAPPPESLSQCCADQGEADPV